MQKHHSLFEVLQSVQRMFDRYWQKPIWIRAEIAKLNRYPHSGHAYPLLVERKEEKSIAEIRSTIWASKLNQLQEKFENTTKKSFSDGIEVLILCELKYSPSHGLTLNIIDIDPTFTLGKMEQERQECIKRLKHENIFDTNKKLNIPIIPKRIAIISVETSKGYRDFVDTLLEFPQYNIELKLFPALLQGDKAVDSIVNQLNQISGIKNEFDLVAIIRGGGGEVGLSCYDNYKLAKAVSTFELPIISGIGHASNLTVVEMVSNTNMITPTALANFILTKYQEFEARLNFSINSLIDSTEDFLLMQNQRLNQTYRAFKSEPRIVIQSEENHIKNISSELFNKSRNLIESNKNTVDRRSRELVFSSKEILVQSVQKVDLTKNILNNKLNFVLEDQKQKLGFLDKKLELLNPEEILKRGYSITRYKGKVDKLIEAESGNTIEIETKDSIISSEIKKIEEKN